MSEKPMRILSDLDWATMVCPCGASICSRFLRDGEWQKFKEEHRAHTNGAALDICTDDGARVYVTKPPPERRPL